MTRNISRREGLVAALAVAFCFLVVGIAVSKMGFRVSQHFGDNFFALDLRQWGILLSGFVGSVAGGGVAVYVLKRTLIHQELLHQRQTAAQNAEATRQRRHQDRLHEEQLRVQKSEASLQRSLASAAAINSGLWMMIRATKEEGQDLNNQLDTVILATHTLRLEREHSTLAAQISKVLADLPLEGYDGREGARKEFIKVIALIAGAIPVWFQADDPAEREKSLQTLQKAHEKAILLDLMLKSDSSEPWEKE